MAPAEIKVTLDHAVPSTTRRVLYLRVPNAGEPPASMENVSVETTVRDGRGQDLKLDEAAFELGHYPTQLSTQDFYQDTEKIKSVYYEEMKAVLAKMTGCLPEHMLVFHHQVRNEERKDNNVLPDGSITTATMVQPYAHGIHTDSSAFHAESFFKLMVGKMPEACKKGRFMYVNVWRNIAEEPIEDNHLAVLDERSVVKPDDYIQQDLHATGYDVLQYSLSARNTKQHRWWYFPRMTRDEVLLFKQWDSDPQLSGRVCFHTAIKDPTARPGAPVRQSIETRALLFFPDHEPNTLPPMVATKLGADSEAHALSSLEKVLGGISYVEGDTSTKAMVVGFMTGMYRTGGAKAVLAAFCEDTQGHFDLRDASKETKERVLELLLERGAAKRIDAIFSGPSGAQLALRMLLQSRAVWAAAGAAGALLINAILARRRSAL